MALKKTLKTIVTIAVIALNLVGCNDNLEYKFNGKIGEENVRFYECDVDSKNYLEVIKSDGSKVIYCDLDNDLKLDCLKITVGDNTTEYSSESQIPNIDEIFQKARTQFDNYLAKITEIQTAPINK